MSGRIRTVKPEWLEDELLAAASDEARVLSVALMLMADDHGRGRAGAAAIAAGAWRYQLERDDGAHAPEILARASRALRELHAMRFVLLYEVSGQRYFAIRTWTKHQRVDRPGKPRIPPPPDEETEAISQIATSSRDTREDVASVSGDTRDILATDLRSPITDHRPRSPTASGTRADPREGLDHRSEADALHHAIDTGAAERNRKAIVAAYREHAPAVPRRVLSLAGRADDTAAMAGMSEAALPGILRRFFADRDMKAKGWPVGHLLANPSQWSDVATGWKRDEGAPRERPAEDEVPPWVLADREREDAHG